MRRINRSYRILGLPPGSSQDEIKRAYRDLAQVWHPDRFAHNPRLQKKAQENLKRINGAFEALKSYDPGEHPLASSRLSDSFAAVLDIGDMLKSGAYRPPKQTSRRGPRVVGLGDVERTGEIRVESRRRSRRSMLFVGCALALLAATVAGAFLLV